MGGERWEGGVELKRVGEGGGEAGEGEWKDGRGEGEEGFVWPAGYINIGVLVRLKKECRRLL